MDRLIDFLMEDSRDKLLFCWVIPYILVFLYFEYLHGTDRVLVSVSQFEVHLRCNKLVKHFFLGIYIPLPSYILHHHSQFYYGNKKCKLTAVILFY